MENTDTGPIDRHPVPPALASALQRAYGLSTRPETLGEWVAATEDRLGEMQLTVSYAELCTTDDGPHVAHFDDRTQAFVCVLDTFLLPYASDVAGPVEVESVSPTGDAVRVTVTESAIDTDPASAVISVGVATDVDEPATADLSPELAYQRLCPYIHAFPDASTYEAWAEDLEGARTMPLPVRAGFDLAGLIAGSDRFFPGSEST